MKILSKAFQYVLVALGAVGFIVACATYVKGKSGVEMGQYYATIYPDAKLSDPDCDALNRVLKKHDKRLYKIQTYKDGKLVKTRGQAPADYIREGLVSEVAQKAQATNFSGCAIQAGSTKESTEATPTPTPGGGGSTTRQAMIPMVNELRPILEKYIKK